MLKTVEYQLEGTACYTGLLLAPADSFNLWPKVFWANTSYSLTLFLPFMPHLQEWDGCEQGK